MPKDPKPLQTFSSENEHIITRRNFIQSSYALVGGMMLYSPYAIASDPQRVVAQDRDHQWFHQPLRIMHTVLRETDASDYDARVVVDYVLQSGANALCVNAGGIVDFWQNPFSAGNINPFMGKRDILAEISAACKDKGIRLLGRVDFRGVLPEVYEKHPDWFAKNHDQRPMMMTYTRPHLHMACYSGEYRNDYANKYIAQVIQDYGLDGIWHNSPGFDNICYCIHCQTGYKEYNGQNLPLLNESSHEELDMYMGWKRQEADRYMDRIKKTIKSFGEDKVYTAEVFSMYEVGRRVNNGIDLKNAFDHFDILVSVAFLTENTEHIHYEDFNYANSIIKFLKSAAPEREAVVMYGGNGTSHRLVIEPSLDVKVWLWEILSMGGRFWNCYFTNVPPVAYDTRNAFVESDANHFVKEHEEILAQHAPVAKIGIYYSRSTRLHYRNDLVEGDRFGEAIRGMETVLIENHIPHDFILDEQVNAEKLKKYTLILLPNVQCMSDLEISLIKEYVRKGGKIIATYESSMYDQEGRGREDFGLSEVFGVNYKGEKWNTRRDTYQFIRNKDHPLVIDEAGRTQLLHLAGYTLKTRAKPESGTLCVLVPTVHNQPPDKAWVEELSSDFPTIVHNRFGQGESIYFAYQPDVIAQQMGHPDARSLLFRAVLELAGSATMVETNAPSSVHIGLTASLLNKGQYVLSLVNTSGGKRPLRELLPVRDIEVKLDLGKATLKKSRVLKSQGELQIRAEGNHVVLEIEKLEDFAAVFLET
ncbi:alpha-amylase family protein [Negadavirga shengliensis]|uniref:Alpha-amylase family protein n=1 Tax=Negadavirga shengliensis TaxID=1389218 RepID=A0ABV9T6Y1_9BACT